MKPEQIETLGSIIEEAINYEALGAMPAKLAQDGMRHGLASIAHRLREIYVEVAGDDPWDGNPTFPAKPQ